jgi:hypothetical protein
MLAAKCQSPIAADDWEYRWATYDAPTYRAVLNHILPSDVILEIGAGDLRLAQKMAIIAQKVYAVEINAAVLDQGLKSGQSLPHNLVPVCTNAQTMDFPPDVTTGVLLMRHCTHFQLYAEKLKSAGCEKLITNARWRMDVECIPLNLPRINFEQVEIGWYACWCGQTGFKSGPVEKITPELDAIIYDVFDCPNCLKR